MKYVFLVSYFLFSFFTAFSQNDPVKQLVSDIKSFTNDRKLNDFLLKKKLIPFSGSDTAILFPVSQVKVDVFRKNLFGDAKNEVVIQLRQEGNHVVSIFYYDQQELKKVPGHLIDLPYEGYGYGEQSFVFSFENIFSENEFSVAVKRHYLYNRYTTSTVELYRVKKDTIEQFYMFEEDESTYSGVFAYDYSRSCTYSFELDNNTYPKLLVKKVKFFTMNQSVSEISGKVSEGTYTERVSFAQKTPAEKKSDSLTWNKYLVRRSDDLKWINNNVKCDSFTTVYLDERFLEHFIQNVNKMPKLAQFYEFHDEEKYHECCFAWIRKNQLYVQSKPDSTGNSKSTVYQLKAPVSAILKKEINPKRLFYIGGKIFYAQKDTIIKDTENSGIIQFSDSTAHFNPYRYQDKIHLEINGEKNNIGIPLSELAPYIKPELLIEFENCCKEQK
jgi:hypothetical protein